MSVVGELGSDELERRREAMLARLEKRRENGAGAKTHRTSRVDELDELAARARSVAESGVCREKTAREIENALAMGAAGHHERKLRAALEEMRAAAAERERKQKEQSGAGGGQKKRGFTFQMKRPSKKAEENVDVKKAPSPAAPVEAGVEIATAAEHDNAIKLINKSGSSHVLGGSDGCDVKLKGLSGCRVEVAFRAAAVHIQDVRDCTLVFLPIDTSILMIDCRGVHLHASAQQIRVHTSTQLHLHVSVRGAVVIEGCGGVRMSPYRVCMGGSRVEEEGGDEWRRPNDFDWLADGHSPNWCVAAEEEWLEETVKQRK